MNEIKLSIKQEQEIQDFSYDLAMIDGPDDMFPPDNNLGDSEPRTPINPSDLGSQALSLAEVYDLVSYRNRKIDKLRKNMGELSLV